MMSGCGPLALVFTQLGPRIYESLRNQFSSANRSIDQETKAFMLFRKYHVPSKVLAFS